jgi:hypothetical protein
MKSITFPGYSRIIGKPQNMTDEECGSLVVRDTLNDGWPAMESVWELSDEDLKMINKTKKVILMVVGHVHPPVSVCVWHEPEFADIEENDLVIKSQTIGAPVIKNPPINPNHRPVG